MDNRNDNLPVVPDSNPSVNAGYLNGSIETRALIAVCAESLIAITCVLGLSLVACVFLVCCFLYPDRVNTVVILLTGPLATLVLLYSQKVYTAWKLLLASLHSELGTTPPGQTITEKSELESCLHNREENQK